MFGKGSSPLYWDTLWESKKFKDDVVNTNNSFVVNYTKRFLPSGSRILEGGCGRGDKVYSLKKNKFDAYGVDYAAKTVQSIKESFPDLQVYESDVKKIDFPDGYFDGYWSLGVIEHFFEGFNEVLREMYRVIRPGGYVFLTVPAMSLIRRSKAKMSMYPAYIFNEKIGETFYQYIYDPKDVIREFTQQGFKLITMKPLDGFKGFKDESWIFNSILGCFYNDSRLFARIIRKMIDILLTPVTFHVMFFVFEKNSLEK
jgi:ubiquinone/menaquinone biosynthesis C-methylase UbiE